ncbi:hypothetical protein [Bradyrhizobium canariense]|uniref:Uncharacterized protein n=1 Tax=Bradyrhizobium canariense TaxID=255045 RepID=A0A1X3GES4_9BRAD|nr:hypothetical protein [Bradyrhizobium canariense]OSI67654.1 hypothetical protein BSZ22_24525 [Bradyrhizobium canariense]OSI77493.1 hypothetical protein BSZ23_22585 [Bradyrhizobium canariense]OSI87385.1 hypothetical protein BSZ24_28000 [Bradyrhizobium canariense]OSI88579.1 hypothetical protein BSZ25_24055 [Bradyrhizobium canariense]OSJ00972.1 hypothetical protein BSZ16_22725 [Bradyrhizobium canariense]
MSNAVTPGATVTLAQNLIDSPTTKPSRRAFLSAAVFAAAGTALSAGDGVAVEGKPDPIFAVIERHRAAYAAYDATLGEDELEERIPFELRQSSFFDAQRGDPHWRVPTDHPDWIAHIEESARAQCEEEEAATELVSTEGLTPAGAVALLAYARDREDRGDQWPNFEEGSWLYLMLCRAVEALAVSA